MVQEGLVRKNEELIIIIVITVMNDSLICHAMMLTCSTSTHTPSSTSHHITDMCLLQRHSSSIAVAVTPNAHASSPPSPSPSPSQPMPQQPTTSPSPLQPTLCCVHTHICLHSLIFSTTIILNRHGTYWFIILCVYHVWVWVCLWCMYVCRMIWRCCLKWPTSKSETISNNAMTKTSSMYVCAHV